MSRPKSSPKPVRVAPKQRPMQTPANVCVNCAPIGHTEVMAMLLVAVFGLVAVTSMAMYRLNEQRDVLQQQQQRIAELEATL
ncbi:MAG: hypothetical protein AAB898_00605 [Patescibacteria group bacterium]